MSGGTATVKRGGRAYRVTCDGHQHSTIDRHGRRLWCLPLECAVCGMASELA